MTNQYNPDNWVKDTVVSEITGRSVHALRIDRHKGRGIPYTKYGAQCLYKIADVFVFMEEHKIRPGVKHRAEAVV